MNKRNEIGEVTSTARPTFIDLRILAIIIAIGVFLWYFPAIEGYLRTKDREWTETVRKVDRIHSIIDGAASKAKAQGRL